MPISLSELANRIGAELHGDGDHVVIACAPIDTAGADHVAFVANSKYVRFLATTTAGAVIVGPGVECPDTLNRLVSEDPYFAFREAVVALHGYRPHPRPADAPGAAISPAAVIHPEASVADDTVVHAGVVIERGAVIGTGCVLYPGVYVGEESTVGDGCLLYPNAVVYDRCELGDRVTLHANCVIGQDGFGYATKDGAHHKIPQSGRVVIEDDVEFGAGCAIERAAIGETRIGRGTKFADLISIGHGTTIGRHCLVVSLVGISGSVEVGNYVALGGQVGVTGHLKIGDGVQAAGKTAITHDVPAGQKIGGIPAVELDQAKRNALAGRDLYGLAKRVRSLERQLKALEANKD